MALPSSFFNIRTTTPYVPVDTSLPLEWELIGMLLNHKDIPLCLSWLYPKRWRTSPVHGALHPWAMRVTPNDFSLIIPDQDLYAAPTR